MNYNTFQPGAHLKSLVKCYWTLEVPPDYSTEKQRVVPDGCIELAFVLGDDIKRFTSDTDFVLQPRAMVIGQITEPFYIQPTGYVNTFAVRFFPYGFANFITKPLKDLSNRETPIAEIFAEAIASKLEQKIIEAPDTQARIELVEMFLLNMLSEQTVIDNIVKSTIDTLFATSGSPSITSILENNTAKRRQLERQFSRQVGISPKQLAKVIRLQTALKILLNRDAESLTQIAYESNYYDQNHFIKDFKEFIGITPKDLHRKEKLLLSNIFYREY